jgi:hypothetical protein
METDIPATRDGARIDLRRGGVVAVNHYRGRGEVKIKEIVGNHVIIGLTPGDCIAVRNVHAIEYISYRTGPYQEITFNGVEFAKIAKEFLKAEALNEI